VVANVELANILKNLPDEIGQPLISDKSLTAADGYPYKALTHPVFGKAKEAYIHPDIWDSLQIIWDRPKAPGSYTKLDDFWYAYDQLNSFLKYSQLTASLFHPGALIESALASGISPPKILSTFAKSYARALLGKKPIVWEKWDIAKDAIKEGKVEIPVHMPDVQYNALENFFDYLDKKAPKGINLAPKGIGKAVKFWNRGLWDQLHPAFKLLAYEKNLFNGLKIAQKVVKKKYGRSLTKNEIKLVKKEVGKFVNDSFGGQNWDLHVVLGSPKMRRALQRAILAPDWTISVIRQASSLVRGPLKTRLGKELMKAGEEGAGFSKYLQGKVLTKNAYTYWARMFAYFFLITQAVNRYTTKKFEGKAKWTWENDPGHHYHILVGRGRVGKNMSGEPKIYLRFGKQFTEPYRYFFESARIGGAKMSPMLRTFIRQISRHDLGTGWPTEYAEDPTFWKRIKDIATMPVPFSLKGYLLKQGSGQFLLMYPLSKGMTSGKTRELIEKTLKEKDETKRQEKMARIAMAAMENGLDWQKLRLQAEAGNRSQALRDSRVLLDKIRKELRVLPNIEAKINLLHAYQERKALTSQQARRLASELKEKQEALKQLAQMDKEIAFVKRISKDKYRDAKQIYDDMRDEYLKTRDEAIMLARKGNKKKAIDIVKEHNKGILGLAENLAQVTNKNIGLIKGSSLYKQYFISPADLRRLFLLAKDFNHRGFNRIIKKIRKIRWEER